MSKFGGNNAPRERYTRFSVQNGKFVRYAGQNEAPEVLDWLHGRLQGIKIREVQKDNLVMLFCDCYFMLDDGQKFIVSTIASSSITADIIGRLANVKDLKHVLVLATWQKDEKFTNVTMREKETFDENEQGEKVPFTKMPLVKKVQNGFSTSMDSTERDNFVAKLIADINGKLKEIGVNTVEEQAAPNGEQAQVEEPQAGVNDASTVEDMPESGPTPAAQTEYEPSVF